jgi:hypothetical protein
MHYNFVHHLYPIVVEDPLLALCLADRTSVEVKWQDPLTRFRAFYTLVHEWNAENLNS